MYYPSLNKCCQNDSFWYRTDIAFKKVYPIRSSGVGNCLFLLARGWEINHQETNKLQIPGDTSGGGGGGGGITGQIEPCIKGQFPLSRNFCVFTHVNFMWVNIMHRRKKPFRGWNKSFTQIEHRHRRGRPRGSGALIPNPRSLLNIYFPLSVFQSSLLLILFRQGVNTCSRNYEETSPICDDPISQSARHRARSRSPLQKSFRYHRCYMWTEALSSMVFLST